MAIDKIYIYGIMLFMENKNVYDSLVLIGPKAVGKSLIAEKLSNKNNIRVFSSDVLEYFSMFFLSGEIVSLLDLKADILDEFSEENFRSKHESCSDEMIERNRNFVVEYLKKIDYYDRVVDFVKMRNIVLKSMQILRSNPNFSLRQQLFVLQQQKILMLSEAIKRLSENVILDLGADIGSVISLTPKEQRVMTQIFGKSYHQLLKEQKMFFKQFDSVVYLAPGVDYKEKVDARSNDQYNKIYTENKDSFISYANLMVSMNGIFVDPSNEIFKQEKDADAEVWLKKNMLMDKSNVDNICYQIEEGLVALNQRQ